MQAVSLGKKNVCEVFDGLGSETARQLPLVSASCGKKYFCCKASCQVMGPKQSCMNHIIIWNTFECCPAYFVLIY